MCNRVKLETVRQCNQYFINQELEYASCIDPCRVLMHDVPPFDCYYCGCEQRWRKVASSPSSPGLDTESRLLPNEFIAF